MKLRRFLIASAAIAALTGVMAGGALAADISATYNAETGTVTVAGCPEFEGDKTLLVLDTNEDGSLLTDIADEQIHQIAQEPEAYKEVVVGPLADGTYELRIGGDGTISTCTFTVGETGRDITLGDVDDSAGISINDAITVIDHTLGVSILTGDKNIAADVDDSEGVSINDAIKVIDYTLGITSEDSHVGEIKKVK